MSPAPDGRWFYRLEFDRDTAYAFGPIDGQHASPMCSYQEGIIDGHTTQVQVCTWDQGEVGPSFRRRLPARVSIYVDGRRLRNAAVHPLGVEEFAPRTEVLPRPIQGPRWGVTFTDEHDRAVCVVGYGTVPDELHIVATRGDHFPRGA